MSVSMIVGANDMPLIASLVYNFREHQKTEYNITFCPGKIIYVDNTTLNVTFVSYEDLEAAKRAFLTCVVLGHTYVARSWSLSTDTRLARHFVSYNLFDGFLTSDEAFFWWGPYSFPHILPGNPEVWIQLLIKGLIDSIKYLHNQDVSCMYFDLPQCYVRRGKHIQIFLVDQLISSYEGNDPANTPAFHHLVKNQSIALFGQMLRKYVLVNGTTTPWVQRDSFLLCFDSSADFPRVTPMSPCKRLEMVSNHPLLLLTLEEVLEIICRTDRELDNKILVGHDMSSIRKILTCPEVFKAICPATSYHYPTNSVLGVKPRI